MPMTKIDRRRNLIELVLLMQMLKFDDVSESQKLGILVAFNEILDELGISSKSERTALCGFLSDTAGHLVRNCEIDSLDQLVCLLDGWFAERQHV